MQIDKAMHMAGIQGAGEDVRIQANALWPSKGTESIAYPFAGRGLQQFVIGQEDKNITHAPCTQPIAMYVHFKEVMNVKTTRTRVLSFCDYPVRLDAIIPELAGHGRGGVYADKLELSRD